MSDSVNNAGSAQKRKARPRGKPFEAGNPGRKVGSQNKRTVLAQGISNEKFQAIVNKVCAKALKGDTAAAKLVLDRMWPVPRGRRVFLPLPATDHPEGIVAAMAVVVAAMGRGELDPSEAQQVEQVLEGQRRALETADLTRRVKVLEGRR